MNIINAYVNMLRYVSASGKKTILETLPQNIKKRTNFRYLGPVEYKSVPIGMPKETNGNRYESWESVVLQAGETKSYALKSWFNIITPREIKLSRIEKEMKKCFSKENIDKIEFFKTLSQEERIYIAEHSYDDYQFLSTLSGHKPAWYCESGFSGKVDFSKIKLNPKIADKFDVIKLPNGRSLYFLNKKEVIKIIEENKDIYCAGQGLNPTENIETIYQNLLKNLENGNIAEGKRGEALYGITLGFPRHSSMIYEMERILDGSKAELRDNIPEFKKKLLELLHSDRFPFKGYPKETLIKLENHIKTMNSTGDGSKFICQCITFGNEEKATQRILALEKDFNENFKVEDLM